MTTREERDRSPTRARAILFLLLLLPAPSLGNLGAVVWWPGSRVSQVLFVLSKLWVLLLPLIWLCWVGRKRCSWSPARQGGLVLGALTGLAIIAAVGGLYALIGSRLVPPGEVQRMAAQTGLSSRTMYLACAAYWIGVNSVLEEYVWRWFVFRRLAELMPERWAIVGSALGFTLHHIVAITIYLPGLTAFLATVGIFVGAALWSWLYCRYRSIWPGYLSHVGADIVIFVIGYRLIFPV
ncbi:MAG: CPBP family intramembrane metalloprotease [Verrucomicrobia bacterium]|jgi:uncharacterized protein|nr:CPBP family intramembrane metalloprotease [Verrucomicrobiota bacterium]